MSQLKKDEKSKALSLASEAFFSIEGIVNNLNSRLHVLQAEAKNSLILGDFLNEEYIPFLNEVIDKSKYKVKNLGFSWHDELEHGRRTLSPSDFGFHNALKREDSEIAYLDFEYFGWDDPAKMISDFLLHPGMSLEEKWKQRFATTVFKNFDQDKLLINRVKLVYPLFGLKWCLILLNEFLPLYMRRRRFVTEGQVEKNILEIQIMKTQTMLFKIKNHFQYFPYYD